MQISSILAVALGLSVLPANAETFCTGVSAPVRVDSRTGQVREAAPVETLTYSTNYLKGATQGASVDIAVNGTVEWQGLTGVGAVQWTTPSTPGTYTLQHVVKNTGGGVITNLTAEFRVLAVIAEPTAVAHATAVVTYENGNPVETNNQGQIVAPVDAQMKVTYKAEKDYYFQNGTGSWSAGFRVGATATTPPKPQIEPRQLVEVDYVDEKGTPFRIKALVISSSSQTLTLDKLDVSFFVVTNDVVMTSGISFLYRNGRPHLILCDGATLQVRGVDGSAAIYSDDPKKDAAYVYGQRLGTGKLSICGGRDAPGLAAKLYFAGGTGVVSGSEGFSALADSVINLNSSLTVRAGNDRHAQTILGQEGWYTVKKVAGMRYLTIAPEVPTVTVPVEQASRKIYVDGVEAVQGMVWSNQTATVVYTADEGYMFASGETEMTFALDTTKSPAEIVNWRDPGALVKAWEETRTLAVDTRARIVVNAPDQVLSIAYATNHWGEAQTGQEVTITSQRASDPSVTVVDKARVNGYSEWMPEQAAYGAYRIRTENKLGMGGTFATDAHLYYGADYQLVYDEDQKIDVRYHSSDTYGLSNLEDVTSYTKLVITANPEYTNVDRYEFAGWKAYSYAERDIGWKTAVEAPELLKNFGDALAAETTFEMPFTNVFLTCSYQWKSNYTDTVHVKSGIYDAWEIHEGETYQQGITTEAGSIVSLRGTVAPGSVVQLVAAATNVWDFTKNGRPCFVGYDSHFGTSPGAVRLVRYDETLTNGVYVIATAANSSVGQTFFFEGPADVTFSVTVGGDWVYAGAKRYKLLVDGGGNLVLTIEYGKFPITYYAMGGVQADGVETNVVDAYVNKGYEFPAKDPTRDNFTFDGWFRTWSNRNEQVTELDTAVSPVQPLAAHSLYAQWTPVSTRPSDKHIAIPDTTNDVPVLTIESFAYAQASHPSQAFETLVTPLYLQSIGTGAFQGVTTLKTLIITPARSFDDPRVPVALKIGQQAFASCTALEEIRIPGEVTSIGNSAFQNCAKLKRILFTGTRAVTYGSKAFYRCGYDNGAGELKVYMTKDFSDNNGPLVSTLASWNTTLKVVPLVGISPASGASPTIAQTDFGTLGADRKVALLVKVPTLIPGTKPDVSSVVVWHSADLETWNALAPEAATAAEDGTVLVEFTMPKGNAGFLKVEVK